MMFNGIVSCSDSSDNIICDGIDCQIRKEFTFNNMHLVRNCTSERCKFSAHAHTYHIEVYLKSNKLDNGGMVVDFGILKGSMKELIKMFDGAYTLWGKESEEYKKFVHDTYQKVITTEFSPSAENYAFFFYGIMSKLIKYTKFANNEGFVHLSKVRVHETHSGWAEVSQSSYYLKDNLDFNFNCPGKDILEKMKMFDEGKIFINEKPLQQICE